MSSIAEMLGRELPKESTDGTEVAMRLLLEESTLVPEEANPEVELRDIGLRGLALWSLVAQLERELDLHIPDAEVRNWRTLGDVLRAVA